MNAGSSPSFLRFVALGDSTTEGVGDEPHPDGSLRGWADRFAAQLAASSPRLLYANLAVRGRRIADVKQQQFPVAMALRPDLVSLMVGVNDLIRPRFDIDRGLADIEVMHAQLRQAGATVLGATFPDASGFSPAARLVRSRFARFNEGLRAIAARRGTVLVDFAAWALASDPRLWCEDRLHASPLGHQQLALAMHAALMHREGASPPDALEAPLADGPGRLARELSWAYRYFLPWLGRRLTGRSSGDTAQAKRPELAPVEAASTETAAAIAMNTGGS